MWIKLRRLFLRHSLIEFGRKIPVCSEVPKSLHSSRTVGATLLSQGNTNGYLQSRTIIWVRKWIQNWISTFFPYLTKHALKLSTFICPHGKIHSLVWADKARLSTLSTHLSIKKNFMEVHMSKHLQVLTFKTACSRASNSFSTARAAQVRESLVSKRQSTAVAVAQIPL